MKLRWAIISIILTCIVFVGGQPGLPFNPAGDGVDDDEINFGTGSREVSGSDFPDEDLGDVSVSEGVWSINIGSDDPNDDPLTQEEVDDLINFLLNDPDSVHTLITLTYDDTANAMDFVVDNDLHNYSWTNVVDADITDTLTSSTLATGRTIAMTGDVSWITGAFDGTANVTAAGTIQANAVALTTDTTGAYVATLTDGLAIDGCDGGSEGATLTIAFDPTELLGSRTWGDASTDTIVWTWNRATGTDPTMTFGNDSVSFNGDIHVGDDIIFDSLNARLQFDTNTWIQHIAVDDELYFAAHDGTEFFRLTGLDTIQFIKDLDIDASVDISGTLDVAGKSTFEEIAADSTTFVVDEVNHRVGIGTKAPVVLLDVFGAVKLLGPITTGVVGPGAKLNFGSGLDLNANDITDVGDLDVGGDLGGVNAAFSGTGTFRNLNVVIPGISVDGAGYIDLTTSTDFLNDLRAGQFAIVQVVNVDSGCGDWDRIISAESESAVGFFARRQNLANSLLFYWNGTSLFDSGAITVNENQIHNIITVLDVGGDTIGWTLADGVLKATDTAVSGLGVCQATLIRLGATAYDASSKGTAKFGFTAILDLSGVGTVDAAFAAALSVAINSAGDDPDAIRAAIMAEDGAITGVFWKLDEAGTSGAFDSQTVIRYDITDGSVDAADGGTSSAAGCDGAVVAGTVITETLEVVGDADVSGDLGVTGAVTGSNLNVANWDTAYTHSQIAGGDSVHVSTTENTNWDTAYGERGSQIAGTGLTWNGVTDKLDVAGVGGELVVGTKSVTVDNDEDIDIDGIGIIFVSGAVGVVNFRGFQNGVDGQMVKIAIIDGTDIKLWHNDAAGTQKLLLEAGADYLLSNTYMGVSLVCNGTNWFVVGW